MTETLVSIATWSVTAFGLLLLIVQMLVHEVGYRFGRSQMARAEKQAEGVGLVVGGMLALMAFVLALTLSFASARFSERRAGTLVEANAIGTAWLRAEAIDHPRGKEISRLLADYVKVRKAFVEAGPEPRLLEELNDRTNALQSQIWGHVAGIVKDQQNPISSGLQASLNETFDMTMAERFAYESRLPPQIFWLLITMTLLSVGAIGYQLGLKGRPVRPIILILTVVWTVVIVDILDLAAARIGSFRASSIAYDWTSQGFSGGISIPPLPGAK